MRMGAVAQLGERELCKLEVVGSIPIGSTTKRRIAEWQIVRRRKNTEFRTYESLYGLVRSDVDLTL